MEKKITDVKFLMEGGDPVAAVREGEGFRCFYCVGAGVDTFYSATYVNKLKPAKPEQYKALKRELELRGYELNLVK